MKILYLDCFNGISGDMTVGALLDLGIDRDIFAEQLAKLNLPGYQYEIHNVNKLGIAALHFAVKAEAEEEHGRHLSEIVGMISDSTLTDRTKELSISMFERLAQAEAKVHGTTPDKVHFHEVGAVDSIVDIVSTAICIDLLSPDMIYCSAVSDGAGFTSCAHGRIPIPVPAVMELFSGTDAKMVQTEIPYELVTPTGAVIATTLAQKFGKMPEMSVSFTGYGAGTRDMETPNVLRVFYGEASDEQQTRDEVLVLEANMDDVTGEILGYASEKLFEAGALDVSFTSIFMKKNRPAYQMSVLCYEADFEIMRDIIFKETTTIGLRYYRANRICMQRETMKMATEFGIADVKVSKYDSIVKSKPEFDSAKRLAESSGAPLRHVYDDVTGQTFNKVDRW